MATYTFSRLTHKRLVPYLLCWSQNFLGILLILHLTRIEPSLRQVRQHLGDRFEADLEKSIGLMLDWIGDWKNSGPVAAWCYQILGGIYDMDNLTPMNMDEEK
jgi:hypothetical protein